MFVCVCAWACVVVCTCMHCMCVGGGGRGICLCECLRLGTRVRPFPIRGKRDSTVQSRDSAVYIAQRRFGSDTFNRCSTTVHHRSHTMPPQPYTDSNQPASKVVITPYLRSGPKSHHKITSQNHITPHFRSPPIIGFHKRHCVRITAAF